MTTLREAIEFLQNRLRTECEHCNLTYMCDHTHKKCTFLESLEIAIESMTIRTLDNALDKGKQKDEEIRMLTDAEKAILRLTIIKDLFDDFSVNSNCVSVPLNREDELALKTAIETLKEQRPHGEWIPITYRPMDEEEYEEYRKEFGELPIEHRKMFSCPMPEDDQEILICTSWGRVSQDRCEMDECGYGLEENGDWYGVIAWMPLPEPYKKEGEME